MTITTDHKPNFTQPISIEPDEMSDFCRRFELAKINLSELEPISQQENSKHNLPGVRVGYDAFHASPRFMKSLMFMFGFTENIFSYFSPAELFERIILRHKDQPVQICFDQKRENHYGGNPKRQPAVPACQSS